ncbi:hypothetical protein QBC36DRAFT_200391 [Triangularia setosa]|uniref:Uncharacterized protein n=1 Tax=Triangularia setosa TaxID=2587417 RepID=A0AAN7A3F0_9PEZI|nr:hypothetical protein QBC36DRAFT_200391 [Podospora setosa]
MGTLIPFWYKPDPPSEHSLDLASFLWGAAMAIACFSFTQAVRQTRRSWLHTHKVNTYIVMVWLEWAACVIMSVVSWLFLIGIIPVDFAILLVFVSTCLHLTAVQPDNSFLTDRTLQ